MMTFLLTNFSPVFAAAESSPVTETHIGQINQLFNVAGIPEGFVGYDNQRRVELKGIYVDESSVDRAFSIAQTIVGVKWVSPVTPEHIKVKEWQKCLANILARERCGPPVPPKQQFDTGSPGPIAEKYALVVGVSKFKNGIQPLQFAGKDAADVASYLTDSQEGGFKKENVMFLRDEAATWENVTQALDQIRARATENDLVLLYLSSHGTPPDKFGGVHVVTYDSEVKPRERIWQTSLTETKLAEFVQQVKAKRLLVVMDACYSNGAYSRIGGFLPPGGKSLEAGFEEGYGRSRDDMARRILGAKTITDDDEMPSQEPAVSDWGRVLISASDARERSWESTLLKNSIFTWYFVDGLKKNRGTILESFNYAKPLVAKRVKQEKGEDIDQTPQLISNRRNWNMSLTAFSQEKYHED